MSVTTALIIIRHWHDESSDTFVIEWDNSQLPKQRFTTVFLIVFWVIWTPMTLFMTFQVVIGGPPLWFGILWLIGGYLGVMMIPILWLGRYCTERVEFSTTEYLHTYREPKWMWTTRWPIDEISKIKLGRHHDGDGSESIVTLSIWKGWRRDMLAYWSKDDFKHELYQVIADYFATREHGIELVDHDSKKLC